MNMSVIDFAGSDSGHDQPIEACRWQVRSAAYSGQNATDVRFVPYFSRTEAKLERAESSQELLSANSAVKTS
jgi:hypothetical protein